MEVLRAARAQRDYLALEQQARGRDLVRQLAEFGNIAVRSFASGTC
ncbi:MAG: hypothetical protein M3Q31_15040 [Actinomycetota bacterium]|nr:hypothetical protein [Actinomycetota bacterium]